MSEILDLRDRLNDPSVDPVRVSVAEGGLAAPGRQRPIERDGRHVLLFPTAGPATHMVDFEDHPVEGGSILHVQPGQVYRFDAGSARGFIVSIAAQVCPAGLFEPSRAIPVVDIASRAIVMRAIIEDLAKEQRNEPRNLAVMQAGAVYLLHHVACAGEPIENGINRSSHDELLRLFRSQVERRFAQTRSVSEYANSIGTSTKTLARASTSLTGLAPKEIVDQRVALEAKRLLAETSDSIASIGETLGFSEATNFTKFFARMTGQTPHEFRR